jgi:hypothetical protein
MCGLDILMPQPQGDYRDVDSRLEQAHGCAVSNEVGTYAFGRQAWTSRNGQLHYLTKQVVHTVTGQYITTQAWENCRRAASWLTLSPLVKDFSGFGP